MSEGSVTRCLHDFKARQDDAAQKLWERYFSQLVRLCQKKLGGHRRAIADEEDVALSAFDSFCQGVRRGQFPQLHDRACTPRPRNRSPPGAWISSAPCSRTHPR
jgi:hypothetical protein